MLGVIDRFFCEIEGKIQKKSNEKTSETYRSTNGIGTLFINSLNDGLNGEWRKDKEKFKHDLLNDIKTFLFGNWKKPWKESIVTDEKGKRLPFCNIKKRPYRGLLTLLNLENHTKTSPFFVTPEYVRKNGGKITNPGEKTYAVGWVSYKRDDITGKLYRCEPDEADVFLPRYYQVISTDFVEGIKVPEFKITPFEKKELIEYVENIIQSIKKKLPPIIYDQRDSCHYNPITDEIHLVKIDAFIDIVNYYKVLFHEVIHSTKHPSRLGRGKPLKDTKDRKAEYAGEELVAEIGASIMATELSLNYDRQNTIVYLKGWLNEAVKRSGKDQDSVLLEAYGYAIDTVEYLLKDVDVDAILPKSIKERAKEETGKSPDKGKDNDKLPEEKKKNRKNSLGDVPSGNINHAFNSKLKEFEQNGYRLNSRNDYFSCGYPGKILTECGLNPHHEIIILQSAVRKAIGQVKNKADEAHDLTIQELIDLPDKIQNPILVINGNTSNSRLLFIDIERKGRKMLAVLQVQKQNERGKYSSIVSIYSKPISSVAMLVEQAIAQNTVWYANKEKLKGFLSVTGQLQLLPRIIESLSGTKVNKKKQKYNSILQKKATSSQTTLWGIGNRTDIVEINNQFNHEKEKALNWLSKQRYNSADVGNTIKSVANIINESNNPLSKNSLGLINFTVQHNSKTYKLDGDLGKFLGEFDRNRYSIVIRGDNGAGKSRLLYQIINAFAGKKYRIAFISLEMSVQSSVTQRYKNEYISPANLKRIDITDNRPDYEQLNAICKNYDVVAIDSWTKLSGLSQADFDRLLKDNPDTIIISIFQSTTAKVTRGGNMPEFDASVVIHVHEGGLAECEKNRFAPIDLKYSVFSKKLVSKEEGKND